MGKSFEEECEKVENFYRNDININLFKVQLKTLPAVIGVQSDEVNTFTDIHKLVQQIKGTLRELMNEVAKTLNLIIVILATNAVSKRLFSAIHLLHTYLQTNMEPNLLNNTKASLSAFFD